MDPTPQAALSELLVSLFDGEDLRIFLAAQEGGRDVLTRLPEGGVSLRVLVYGAVSVLERHGRLGDDFFAALADHFPRRRDSIAPVREAWQRTRTTAAAATPPSGVLDEIFGDRASGCPRTFFSV